VKFQSASFSDIEDDPLGIPKLRSKFDVIMTGRMEQFNLTGQVVIIDVARGCVEVFYKVVLPGNANPEHVQAFMKALTEDVAGTFEKDPIFKEYGAAPNGKPQLFENVEAYFALNAEPLELGGGHEYPSKTTAAMRIIVLVVTYVIVGFTVARYLVLTTRILDLLTWLIYFLSFFLKPFDSSVHMADKVPDSDVTESDSVITEILCLIVGIMKQQSQVRQNKKNCTRLIDHLRQLEAIVGHLKSLILVDPSHPIVGSFHKLLSSLEEANALIARSGSMGKVSAFIHAMSTKQEFNDVSSALSMSIEGLVPLQSASGRNDIEEISRSVNELAQDMVSPEYALELDGLQAGMHGEMRKTIQQMHNDAIEPSRGRMAIRRLLENAVGKAELQDEQQQTLKDIADELQSAKGRKGEMDIFYLEQIRAGIGESALPVPPVPPDGGEPQWVAFQGETQSLKKLIMERHGGTACTTPHLFNVKIGDIWVGGEQKRRVMGLDTLKKHIIDLQGGEGGASVEDAFRVVKTPSHELDEGHIHYSTVTRIKRVQELDGTAFVEVEFGSRHENYVFDAVPKEFHVFANQANAEAALKWALEQPGRNNVLRKGMFLVVKVLTASQVVFLKVQSPGKVRISASLNQDGGATNSGEPDAVSSLQKLRLSHLASRLKVSEVTAQVECVTKKNEGPCIVWVRNNKWWNGGSRNFDKPGLL